MYGLIALTLLHGNLYPASVLDLRKERESAYSEVQRYYEKISTCGTITAGVGYPTHHVCTIALNSVSIARNIVSQNRYCLISIPPRLCTAWE
jgi:hypothetical protein